MRPFINTNAQFNKIEFRVTILCYGHNAYEGPIIGWTLHTQYSSGEVLCQAIRCHHMRSVAAISK